MRISQQNLVGLVEGWQSIATDLSLRGTDEGPPLNPGDAEYANSVDMTLVALLELAASREKLAKPTEIVISDRVRGHEDLVSAYRSLERELSAKTAECERLKAELDLASPKEKCARCGGEFRWYQMTPEEGDEWECLPCNERENARERAAVVQP